MNRFPRWLLAVFVFAMAALLVGGAIFYRAQKSHHLKEAVSNLEAIGSLKVDQIVQWRSDQFRDAELITESPYLFEGVARWMADPEAENTRQILKKLGSLGERDQYFNAMVVDIHGKILLSLDARMGSIHSEAAETLEAAIRSRRPMLSDLHKGPVELPSHIDVFASLVSESGGDPARAARWRCCLVPEQAASQAKYRALPAHPFKPDRCARSSGGPG